jgi:polyhydroxybutyrate depolymerase
MRDPRALLLLCAAAACDASKGGPDIADVPDAGPAVPDPDGGPGDTLSAGCGKPARDAPGGVQRTIEAGPAADGTRSYYISVPEGYDPSHGHAVIFGYPGTNWTGAMIQPYLDLEGDHREDEIFVYLDPLWRDFEGWGNLGGWVLGPNAAPANGDGDLAFTSALLDELEDAYCIDTSRVFVTGHSWGGDMAQVVACFLGDRFTAAVPVAANRPYWFTRPDGSFETCAGDAAVWTMFGVADDHFGSQQDYPGQFGDEQRDFWLDAAGCTGADANSVLDEFGAGDECFEYAGCDRAMRYCLYGPDTGHQVPDYYPRATLSFFRSF